MIKILNYGNKFQGKQSRISSLVMCEICKKDRIVCKADILRRASNEICRVCANSGEKNPMYGKIGYMRGRTHPPEMIEKFKLSARRGKDSPMFGRKGPLHPMWNPNLTQEDRINRLYIPEFIEWSRKVKERDNFICQITYQRGCELASHHLYCWSKYQEKRFSIDNGVTLAKWVHALFHKIYGKNHNTPNQLIEFKQYLQEALEII